MDLTEGSESAGERTSEGDEEVFSKEVVVVVGSDDCRCGDMVAGRWSCLDSLERRSTVQYERLTLEHWSILNPLGESSPILPEVLEGELAADVLEIKKTNSKR